MTPRPILLGLAGAAILAVVGCTDSSGGSGEDAQVVDVTSTDDACDVAVSEVPAGDVRFSVTNEGSQVTEFYLLAEDGENIIGEVENIGPGLTRPLVVSVSAGNYVTACKPGMTGDGIRGEFRVTEP